MLYFHIFLSVVLTALTATWSTKNLMNLFVKLTLLTVAMYHVLQVLFLLGIAVKVSL